MQAIHQRLQLNKPSKFYVYPSCDSIYPPHWHEAIEIVYALDDGIGIDVNNNVVTLKAGDIAVINSDDIHSFVQQATSLKRLIVQIEAAFYNSFSQTISNKKFSKILIPKVDENHRDYPIYNQLSQHLQVLVSESTNQSLGYEMAMEAEISAILVFLMRSMPQETLSIDDKRKSRVNRERLASVIQYIEENYQNSISLSEIAQVSKFSKYHFTRFFKEATGLTFSQYLNRLRIAKSAILLTNTSDSIIDISYHVGFGSIKTFNRVFKLINGCSPSQFRKNQG